MSFNSLLCHTARVLLAERTNVDGRITETWNAIGIIACRFSSPATSTAAIVDGASAPQVDATVFAGPELQTLIVGTEMPLRLCTTDPGIAGTYEILKPIRSYFGRTAEVHHCECDVRRVQE